MHVLVLKLNIVMFCDSVPVWHVCQMCVKKREEISESTTRQRMDDRSISINAIISN